MVLHMDRWVLKVGCLQKGMHAKEVWVSGGASTALLLLGPYRFSLPPSSFMHVVVHIGTLCMLYLSVYLSIYLSGAWLEPQLNYSIVKNEVFMQ